MLGEGARRVNVRGPVCVRLPVHVRGRVCACARVCTRVRLRARIMGLSKTRLYAPVENMARL